MKTIKEIQEQNLNTLNKEIKDYDNLSEQERKLLEDLVLNQHSVWFRNIDIPGCFFENSKIKFSIFLQTTEGIELKDIPLVWKAIFERFPFGFEENYRLQSTIFVQAFHEIFRRNDNDILKFKECLKSSLVQYSWLEKNNDHNCGMTNVEKIIDLLLFK